LSVRNRRQSRHSMTFVRNQKFWAEAKGKVSVWHGFPLGAARSGMRDALHSRTG